ncbi:hypothetical protein NDU88_012707 [Pleurodeles waltl]|uniref:Uncharacterized protein n=1 Tax=Pleurodeles waltl TaxID=8319 RepID=A0AAV7R1I1_PLEWA|nr:hypothetical protein NDU88_012707 [Pleurodeles waltl]
MDSGTDVSWPCAAGFGTLGHPTGPLSQQDKGFSPKLHRDIRGRTVFLAKHPCSRRGALASDLGYCTTITESCQRVKTAEADITTLAPQQKAHTAEMEDLRSQVRFLHKRAEDAEGRACPNNVRLIGMPEGTEGPNATLFIEEWWKTRVAPQGLTDTFTVLPQPIIARILNYRDRDTIVAKGP